MENVQVWGRYLEDVKHQNFFRSYGRITKVSSMVIEARGVKGYVGDICEIKKQGDNKPHCLAEIVGLKEGTTLLMPYADTRGISLESEVIATAHPAVVHVDASLLGRIIDPFGQALDGRPLSIKHSVPLRLKNHNPLHRQKITETLETGVRAIDSFLPIGKGQRVGVFAGSGVGKTTLLGMIAKHAKSEINVIALIGERGREVGDFVEKTLGVAGLAKSIIVVATSDQPALVRELAAHTATAIAEYFCDMKKEVLLIMDSVTRFAMAHREIGLSIGEPATSRGYTPSSFAALPKLVERAGNFEGRGSITGIYTVLVEGDDLHEPVSDHMRSILDGHIVLSRELAHFGHFPAIDLLASISRLASDLWAKQEHVLVTKILKMLSLRDRHKDMIDIGAYKQGSNEELDRAIAFYPEVEKFLIQYEAGGETKSQLFELLTSLCAKYKV